MHLLSVALLCSLAERGRVSVEGACLSSFGLEGEQSKATTVQIQHTAHFCVPQADMVLHFM